MTVIGTLKFLHVLTGFWMTAGLVGRGVAQLRAERTTEIRSLQLLVELVGRFERRIKYSFTSCGFDVCGPQPIRCILGGLTKARQ